MAIFCQKAMQYQIENESRYHFHYIIIILCSLNARRGDSLLFLVGGSAILTVKSASDSALLTLSVTMTSSQKGKLKPPHPQKAT